MTDITINNNVGSGAPAEAQSVGGSLDLQYETLELTYGPGEAQTLPDFESGLDAGTEGAGGNIGQLLEKIDPLFKELTGVSLTELFGKFLSGFSEQSGENAAGAAEGAEGAGKGGGGFLSQLLEGPQQLLGGLLGGGEGGEGGGIGDMLGGLFGGGEGGEGGGIGGMLGGLFGGGEGGGSGWISTIAGVAGAFFGL